MKKNFLILLLILSPFIGRAQTDTTATENEELLQEPEKPETTLINDTAVPRTSSFVGLINGKKIPAYTIQYKTPLFKPRYFLIDDSMRIAAEEVRMYQDESGFYHRVSLERNNREFAKRTSAGRISKYYTVRTSYEPGYPGYGYGYGYNMGYPRQRYTYYFSKDDGMLQSLNYKNLQAALADNAGSMESLRRYKKGKNIETGLFVAGAGLLIGGMVTTVNNLRAADTGSAEVSPALYAGLVVVNVPWIIRLFQKDRLEEAIDLYNYQRK